MRLADLIVLYLAAGAPFAVYDMTRPQRRTGPPVRSFAIGLLWPLFLARSITHRMFVSNQANSGIEAKLSEIRENVEARKIGSDAAATRQFRQVFETYSALATGATDPVGRTGVAELLTLCGHTNPMVAATCLARRERRTLELHLEIARRDAADHLPEWATRAEIESLAALVHDPALLDNYSAAAEETRPEFAGRAARAASQI